MGAVIGRETPRGLSSCWSLLKHWLPRHSLGSPSLRGFRSSLALPTVSQLREKATTAARPQQTCPLASRAGVKPQHDKLPGGNDEGPPATQNISLQPSGARRALHEPPARSKARSRPQGGQQARQAKRVRAGVRALQHEAETGSPVS